MLSELLTSSYLQYKKDTNAVASWLACTAKRCGYAVDQLTQTRKEKPSGRLKGKARKQAKSEKAPATPTYTIAIKDFVSLAEWIARDHRPPIHVPSSFVTALERAIRTRRRHGDYLAHKSKSAGDSHAYFIGILEHVHETLRPRFPREALGAGDDVTKKTKINRFEGLEVQEPSKEFLQMRDLPVVVPMSSVGSEANYQADQMKDLDEGFTAFSLLLDDYHTFRSLIHRTWAGYRNGQYDLVAASLMTNTALDLARRLEDDAKPLFDQFGGPKQMLTAMYLALCSEKGEDQACREHPGDDMNFRMWEVSSGIFWPIYQVLQSFVPMVDAQHIPQYKPCLYGQYDPTSHRTKMTAWEKFTEDKIILKEHLGEFALLCMRVLKMVAEDELTCGLRIAFRTHGIPLALTFATQVYLDIHHILREDITRGCADLETTTCQVSNSIELNLERHKSLRVETWPPSNDLLFKNIQQTIDYLVRYDPLIKAKVKLNRPLSEPFKLWRSHPLFCGLITYHIKIKFQEDSVAFVNAWGSLLYTYHLHNAARQKLLQGEWLDIDLIMSLQGGVFVGDIPCTPEDYLKRFTLSMGYSATAFARTRRRISPQASTCGPRGLQELAPVAQMFRAGYCDSSGQTEWTRADIERVVSKAEWTDDENGLSESTQGLSLSWNGRKQQAPSCSTEGDTHRQLTTVELLERLRNALQGETLELSFPYLALHRMCWLLLRRIDEHCRQDLQNMFGFEYIENENELPFVVGYILMAATETRQVGYLLKPRNSDQATSRLLDEAAFVMEGYIEYGGNFSCRLLETHNIVVGQDDEG